MKKCPMCGEVKPITEYGRAGRETYCRQCDAQYRRDRYARHRLQEANKKRHWSRLHRKEISARVMQNYRTSPEFRRHVLEKVSASRKRNMPRRIDNTFQAYHEVLLLREENGEQMMMKDVKCIHCGTKMPSDAMTGHLINCHSHWDAPEELS